MGLGNPDLERQIRAGETLSRKDVLEVWDDVRTGVRKQFPHNSQARTSFLKVREHRTVIGQEFAWTFRHTHGAYPEGKDYRVAKLGGFLARYYGDSPYQSLCEAGFTTPENVVYYDVALDKMPWLVIRLPQNFWQSQEDIVKATRWAVRTLRKFGKGVDDITWRDMENLVGPIRTAQKEHVALPDLLRVAGYSVDTSARQKVPDDYWANQDNRHSYVLRRTKELGRVPRSREVPSSLLRVAGGYNNLLREAGLLDRNK